MKPLILLLVTMLCGYSAENYKINVTANIDSLMMAKNVVTNVDKLPILSIRQIQIESDVKMKNNVGKFETIKTDDQNSLINLTGVVRGPLDGGGNEHVLRFQDGKWVIVKTSAWDS